MPWRITGSVLLSVFFAMPATAALTEKDWAGRIYRLGEQGMYDAAQTVAETAVKQYPTSAELWYLLGKSKIETSDPAGALLAFAESYRIQPTPQIALELANLLVESNRRPDAIHLLSALLEISGSAPEVHAKLGNLYRDEANYREAIEHYRAALEQQPQRPEEWSSLIGAYVFLGDARSASEEISACSARLGPVPLVRFWEGRLLQLEGHPIRAAELMGKAISELPNPPSEWLLHYGQALMTANDLAAARDVLERAVAKQPFSPGYYFPLGQLYRRLRDQEAAREALLIHQLIRGDRKEGWEAIPANHPAYPFIRDRLASEALKEGEFAAAIEHASAALAAAPGFIQASLNLSNAFSQSGEKQKALDMLLSLNGRLGADPQYQLTVASLFSDTGQPEKAEERRALAARLETAVNADLAEDEEQKTN